MNSVEIKQKRSEYAEICRNIINTCKTELREMTDEEQQQFDDAKKQVEDLNEELKALREKLNAYEAPKEDEEPSEEGEENPDEPKDNEEDKNTQNRNMKKTILGEVRAALENGTKQFTIENRAGDVTVNAGTDHEGVTVAGNADAVQKEYQPIIDPLYANTVLNSLGVRTYTGLPMGDVVIPKLGKGAAGWASEVAKAMKSDNSLSVVTMKPHRICAYVDISNQMIAQDNIQFEEAVRRDIQNALADKIEATLFGYAAEVAGERPAGLFYNQTLTDATSYGKICDAEAGVEENNYTGTMKYLMSPKSKAWVRQTQKSSKNTEGILENGTIDGTEVITTSNVPANTFIYGAFDDIAYAEWGNIDVKIDDLTQAVYGVTRLVINMYVDFKTVRDGGLVFGTTDASKAGTVLA